MFNPSDFNECLVPAMTSSSLCINAQCSNTNGSFVCVCNSGFISDGKNNCEGMSMHEPFPSDSS